MVRSRYLTPESLIRAMKAADFYASTGVDAERRQYDAATKTIAIDIQGEEGVTYKTAFVGTPIKHDLSSTPVLDREGKPVPHTTDRYKDEIGKTFETVEGAKPTYTLTGEELYVRAVITSSKPHPRPTLKDQNRAGVDAAWDGRSKPPHDRTQKSPAAEAAAAQARRFTLRVCYRSRYHAPHDLPVGGFLPSSSRSLLLADLHPRGRRRHEPPRNRRRPDHKAIAREEQLPAPCCSSARATTSSTARRTATARVEPSIEPMTEDTIFDLASMSKCIGTRRRS
jgi:hypothetical protein